MAKVFGQSGDVSIGGLSLQVKKWDGKLHCDEAEITNAASGGWKTRLAGGLQDLQGSVEMDFDPTINTASSNFMLPFTNTAVSFVLNLGSSGHSFTFTGQLYDLDIDSEPHVSKPISLKGTFKSSGAVVFS